MDDLWTRNYYESRLLERNFRSVAQQTGLDLKEVRILAYLRHIGGIDSFRELAEFIGITQIMLYAYLERLSFRKLIELELKRPGSVRLTPQAGHVMSLIENAIQNAAQTCRENMTAEEAEAYEALRKTAFGALQKRLEI